MNIFSKLFFLRYFSFFFIKDVCCCRVPVHVLAMVAVLNYCFVEPIPAIEREVASEFKGFSFDKRDRVFKPVIFVTFPIAINGNEAFKLFEDIAFKFCGSSIERVFSVNMNSNKRSYKRAKNDKEASRYILQIFEHFLIGFLLGVPAILVAMRII